MRTSRRVLTASLLLLSLTASAQSGFSPEIRISSIAGPSTTPMLAASGAADNLLHAVWSEYVNSGAPSIYYARSTTNGDTWSTPVPISQTATAAVPVVAADANHVYALWTDVVGSGELYLRRSADSGSTWSTQQQLTNSVGYSRPSGLLVDSGGCVHVLWFDDRAGYGQVYHRMSCDFGATFSPEVNLNAFDPFVDYESPRIAEASDGTLYVIMRSSKDGQPQQGWPPMDEYLLRSTSVTRAGTAADWSVNWLSPAQKISRGLPEELGNTYAAKLAAGASGKMHVAYWRETNGNNLVYRGGYPKGRGLGPVIDLSEFGPNHLEFGGDSADTGGFGLGEDASGNVHVVFAENNHVREGFQVGSTYYRRSGDGGMSFDVRLQASTSTETMHASGIYHNGRFHMIWADFRNSNQGAEIYYRNTAVDGFVGFSLVDHYYLAILGRTPDAGGKAFWESEATRMQSLGVDVKEAYMVMAGYFFNSAEYVSRGTSDSQYVTDLYNTFFNRAPDAGGLAFWTGQLAQGLPRNIALYGFLFSPEFNSFMSALFGNTTSRAEVYAVVDFYRGILNRLPDTPGFNFWLGQFRAAQCLGVNAAGAVYTAVDSISSQFIGSPEYTSRNRSNTEYVSDLYYAFLRRSGDLAGVNFWINRLNTGAETRQAMRTDFINSPEFNGRVNAIVAQGC
jgi:hypothetical protein